MCLACHCPVPSFFPLSSRNCLQTTSHPHEFGLLQNTSMKAPHYPSKTSLHLIRMTPPERSQGPDWTMEWSGRGQRIKRPTSWIGPYGFTALPWVLMLWRARLVTGTSLTLHDSEQRWCPQPFQWKRNELMDTSTFFLVLGGVEPGPTDEEACGP